MNEYTNCEYRFSVRFPFAVFVFLILFLIQSLAQDMGEISHHYSCNLQDSTYESEWINIGTRVPDTIDSTNYFSKTDRTSPYSFGIEKEIPADLQRKNFRISIQGKIWITNATSNNQLVVSILRGDSAIFWEGKNMTDKFGKLNQWETFSDSVLVPRNIPKDSKVKIFLWNQDGKSETDVDDLGINFTEVKLPSYLLR